MKKIIVKLLLALITIHTQAGYSSETRPNIVIILTDDVGYSDIFAVKEVDTPNIYKLVETSILFTNAYATSPICSPSRAGLFTGVYQQRFGWTSNPGHSSDAFIPEKYPLLSEVLKGNGYDTAFVGKWHLGYHPKGRPNKRGFNYFSGFLGGTHSYHYESISKSMTSALGPVFKEGIETPIEKQLTNFFSDEAVRYIGKLKQPFFLVVSTNAAHAPNQPSDSGIRAVFHDKVSIDAHENKNENAKVKESRRFYLGHIADIDQLLGNIQKKLKDSGKDNTYLFFTNDNGGYGIDRYTFNRQFSRFEEEGDLYLNYSKNTPLKGGKGVLYEGGIRVPLMVSGPGVLKAKISSPFSHLDLFPTIESLSKTNLNTFSDGVDMSNCIIEGECNDSLDRKLFWGWPETFPGGAPTNIQTSLGDQRNNPMLAILKSKTKLLLTPRKDFHPICEIYNISADNKESKSLCLSDTPYFKLRADLDQWIKSMNCSMLADIDDLGLKPKIKKSIIKSLEGIQYCDRKE